MGVLKPISQDTEDYIHLDALPCPQILRDCSVYRRIRVGQDTLQQMTPFYNRDKSRRSKFSGGTSTIDVQVEALQGVGMTVTGPGETPLDLRSYAMSHRARIENHRDGAVFSKMLGQLQAWRASYYTAIVPHKVPRLSQATCCFSENPRHDVDGSCGSNIINMLTSAS